MGQQIIGVPDAPAHTQTVTIGEQYTLRLVWLPRMEGWYLDLYALDGTAIVQGRRLSPGYAPLASLLPEVDLPPGIMIVIGPDDYRQEDLGETLQILRYDLSELPDPAPAEDLDIVIELSP